LFLEPVESRRVYSPKLFGYFGCAHESQIRIDYR
jgi:hypothetical protein